MSDGHFSTRRLSIKRLVRLIVGGCGSLACAAAWSDDVTDELARIAKANRAEQVPRLEKLANQKSLSDSQRLAATTAFAKLAQNLSPHYGRGTYVIDSRQWRAILEWGHEKSPENRDVLAALVQLLVDEHQRSTAAPLAAALLKQSPDDHFAKACQQWCEMGKSGDPVSQQPRRKIPLHFCVLTRNPSAGEAATKEQCFKETKIFNDSFRTLSKAPLVEFVFKGFSPYSEIRNSRSSLVEWGDRRKPYDSGEFMKAFNACDEPRLRDRGAINVYIFDSYSQGAGFGDKTSHGVRNSNRPYVLIDWERLGANVQNAEPHEMGHAFGLEHVGIIGAKGNTSTNIMASAAEGFGSGGRRDLGFTDSQAALILYHAERTASRLGLTK